MARAKDFDLAAELGKPSFTPAVRDVPALVELVVGGDEPGATRAATALAKLGDPGRAGVTSRLAQLDPQPTQATGLFPATTDDGARPRLVGVLGMLARVGDADARAAVFARMTDPAARVRRAAATALGKLGGDDAIAALLARWDATDATADERRVLAEALGKLGGTEAITRLEALAPGDDAELARRRDRALLMATRTARREDVSVIATDVRPPAPITVRLRCRPGLEPLLVAELGTLGVTTKQRGDAVELALSAPWATLFASRLWATASIALPFELASSTRGAQRKPDRVADPDALAAAITRSLTSAPVRALLAAWTRGPIRWRLGFAHGHKRAIVWRVARDVVAAAPELLNDPTATTWDVSCDVDAGTLELVPRRFDDPRFAWRVADVPAASHPTVAAALAWVAEARDGDRVWDPFCGSGAELVERARRGAYRSLAGSDLDPAAITAARANLDAAGVAAELTVADARTHAAGTVDAVVTNPPLGSRVRGDAAALLVEALPNLVRALAPHGRLVWITPAPRRTTPAAEALGLRRTQALAVDLGGVRGQLERWEVH